MCADHTSIILPISLNSHIKWSYTEYVLYGEETLTARDEKPDRIEFFNPELRAVVNSAANTLLTHCPRIQLSVMKAQFIYTPASRIMSSVFFMEQGREPGYYNHCKIQRELIQNIEAWFRKTKDTNTNSLNVAMA